MVPVAGRWIAVAATVAAFALGANAAAGASSKPSITKKFCDSFKSNSMLSQQAFLAGPDGATGLNAKLSAGITAAKGVVPAAIADEYGVVTTDSPTDFAAIATAQKAVDTWVLAHCKFEVVKVVADDSAVTMPKTLKPGFVAFDVTNHGTAARYYGVVPLAAGQTVDQLVASPLDQVRPSLITEVQTPPGEGAVAYGSITKPGVYVILDGNSAGTPQPSYASFTVKK